MPRHGHQSLRELAREVQRLVEAGGDIYAAAQAFWELSHRAGSSPYVQRLGYHVRRVLTRALEERSASASLKRAGDAISSPPKALKMQGFPMTFGGAGGSTSSYTDRLKSNARAMAQMSRDSSTYSNLDNGQIVPVCGYGDQAYVDVMYGLHQTQLKEMFQQIIDTTEIDTEYDTNKKTMSLYIQDMYASIDITNVTNSQCWVEIYDIRPKHDINDALSSPANLVKLGIQQITNSGLAADLNHVSTDPFMSDLFTQNYSVYKSTRICLTPGELHTHRVHWAPNMLISRERVEASTGYVPPYFLERLTYFSMIRFHGAPCVVSSSGVDSATYCEIKLGICWHSKVDFSFTVPYFDYAHLSDTLVSVADAAQVMLPTGVAAGVQSVNP